MALQEQVSAIMHAVAHDVVRPRFGMLNASDIAEKSPGELVTCVDREAETRLQESLAALGLDARIIGEEATANNPRLLDDLARGQVWLIDPLDGTANFASGHPPCGMMVALLADGVVQEGWILDPLSGRECHARRGHGATCDGRPVHASGTGLLPPQAALGTQFLSARRRAGVHAAAERALAVTPIPRCAAESYARLVLGQDDIALFQRILPWDHAAGVLFLEEAGGHATHWDSSPFRIGGPGVGVLAAANQSLWQIAADALLTPATGLSEMDLLPL